MSGNVERNAQAFHSVVCDNVDISYFALVYETKSDLEVQKRQADISVLSACKDRTFCAANNRGTKTS